jgi:glycerol-3-phosphate acyltransferase PlsX
MNIGIDIMGGDFAPEAPLRSALLARRELPDTVKLYLIGNQDVIYSYLINQNENPEHYTIVHAADSISMGEHGARAFTHKPQSSIAIAYKLLQNRDIDAFVGTGNTGAMYVGGVLSVKPIDGIQRPCIMTLIPKENGGFGVLLDVGANADCKPETLVQFAVLGSLYSSNVLGIENPKVGLINIGEEEEKGNILAQATYQLMQGSLDFNFIGNIEGRDLFGEKADVMVCDGFTGNIVLKMIESFYSIFEKRGFSDSYINRLNYEQYGGTPILGINSTVIVGHGISNAETICKMIHLAKEIVEARLTEKIKAVLEHD